MNIRFLLLASCFLLLAFSASAETVEIWSAADWDYFATRVNNGESKLDAVMMRNVTLSPSSPRCGTSSTRYYRGEFNGNGKTLIVAFKVANGGSSNPAAPFAWYSDDTYVHDLHVAGTITTDAIFAGGILGHCVKLSNSGVVKLERCRVSATITNTINGDASSGGIVSWAAYDKPDIYVTDCVFDGTFNAPNGSYSGGLVGCRSRCYLYMKNCLFNPAGFSANSTGSYTLVRNGCGPSGYPKNSYYTHVYGTTQGIDGRGKTAAQLVSLLGSNWQVADDKAVPKMTVSIQSQASGTSGFTYHGSLRDSQGNALSVLSHTIEFRIYSQAAGGSAHWGRRQDVTLDADGSFAVPISDEDGEALGDGTPGTELEEVLSNNAGTTLFLGLTVDGGSVELSPRQKLIASPYATCALDGGAASGNMAVAGNVSGERLTVSGTLSAGAISTTDGLSVPTFKTTGTGAISGNLTVKGKINGLGTFPVGGILIWSGTKDNLPPGWALCDGNNGTPDLRDRFIVGAGSSYSPGNKGGAATVTLNRDQLPSHRHDYLGDNDQDGIDGAWSKYIRRTIGNNDVGSTIGLYWSCVYGTSYTGDTQAHENRPPYYALCYIMRVK